MGALVDGKWIRGGFPTDKRGAFVRKASKFHGWVKRDGSTDYLPEAGRYLLYVSLACPWSHRTILFRKLKKLEKVIELVVTDPHMDEDGWKFSEFPGAMLDPIFNAQRLSEIYLKQDACYTGRVTVPVLFDKKSQTIVNNESKEIIRMLDQEFCDFTKGAKEFFPAEACREVDNQMEAIYQPINNGVYRAGFAKSQEAYEEAIKTLFQALEKYETLLSQQPYVCGERITAADWCLFVTLVRFDLVYHYHFKCSKKKIQDYPYLWNYLERLYHYPGVAETCNFDHIKRHYYWSHEKINPRRIVPVGPSNPIAQSDQILLRHRGRYLNYLEQRGWEWVERNNCQGVVILLAKLPGEKVLLVEQHRIPFKKNVIEFPAGLVGDEKKESFESAAQRELLEETGYEAKSFELVAEGPPSAGLTSETVRFYLAQDLTKREAGGGDSTEDIIVHEIPLAKLASWLAEQEGQGKLVDPKIYAGIYFLK